MDNEILISNDARESILKLGKKDQDQLMRFLAIASKGSLNSIVAGAKLVTSDLKSNVYSYRVTEKIKVIFTAERDKLIVVSIRMSTDMK